jgi:hypothetical protein
MIVMFSRTAGVADGEAGIAGGTALIGQRLLEAIFGDQAVRDLAQRAHADLDRRVIALLDGEKRRYQELVATPVAVRGSQSSLREAAQQAEYARHSDFLGAQGVDGPDFGELSVEGKSTS